MLTCSIGINQTSGSTTLSLFRVFLTNHKTYFITTIVKERMWEGIMARVEAGILKSWFNSLVYITYQ